MLVVYVPLSAASQLPPGGVIRYVAVIGLVSLDVLLLTYTAVWLKPGPVTTTSPVPMSEASTATLSA